MADRAELLSDLAVMVARAPRTDPLAVRLCRAAVEILGAQGGAVTLASAAPERITVFATDPTARRLEELQDVLGEGPGFEAHRRRRRITLDPAEQRTAFPMFADLARQEAGAVTLHALPMRSGDGTVGVLTVYLATADHLVLSLEDAQFLADAVGAALLQDVSAGTSGDAWSDRSRVHQATGMIVAQLGIGVDDALALLRAHAFAEGTTMNDIASSVIDRALVFGRSRPDPTPGGDQEPTNEIEER